MAAVDALNGTLLVLTDATELRRLATCGRARCVRRRTPCTHDRRWPEGPTAADNLTGYCTRHHRGKHRAPGWTYELAPDGTLTITTPTGLVALTEPPPYPTTGLVPDSDYGGREVDDGPFGATDPPPF